MDDFGDLNNLLSGDGDSGGFGGEQGADSTPSSSNENLSLEQKLAQYGVPDSVLNEVKNGMLMQSDYTRKTQELADYRRSIELQQQQINTLAQWMSQGKQQEQQPSSEFDRTWSELTQGAEDPRAVEPIMKLNKALESDINRHIESRVKPLEAQIAEYKAREQYGQIYNTTIHPNFGNHLDDLWPEAQAMSMDYLRKGQVVDPLTIIAHYQPQRIRDAAAKHAQQNERKGGLPSEGMVTQRTEQPIVAGGGDAKPLKPDSTEAILREVEAMTRRGVSA